jgi:hypothetical protein
MVALATAASVAPAASTIAIELLLIVLPAARSVFVSLAALVAMMLAMLALLARGPLVGTSILTRSTLLLISRLARRFRRGRSGCRCGRSRRGSGRGSGRRCGGVLGRDRDRRGRRVIDWFVSIDWSLGSVAVRVRLAIGLGGRTVVRARATAATTMRASAFGHATMFVMGCVLALSRQLKAGVFSRCSCGSRGRTKAHASL